MLVSSQWCVQGNFVLVVVVDIIVVGVCGVVVQLVLLVWFLDIVMDIDLLVGQFSFSVDGDLRISGGCFSVVGCSDVVGSGSQSVCSDFVVGSLTVVSVIGNFLFVVDVMFDVFGVGDGDVGCFSLVVL